jgi:TonB family protein
MFRMHGLSIGLVVLALAPAVDVAQATPENVRKAPVITQGLVVHAPDVKDYIPAKSIALEEEGNVQVKLCYDVNGKAVASTLSESSGKQRLDDAAIRMGKQFKFIPGRVDGVPVAGCIVETVKFRLQATQ